MKKGKKGVLTVEASIVLPLAMLFILFLLGFARVYRAQSLVSHAALQSADAVAMESYLRETALRSDAEKIVQLASKISATDQLNADSLESLRSADLPSIARQKFIAAVADTEENADKKLKSLGIKDGLNGIDFSGCNLDIVNDDVIVTLDYSIEMQFKILGYNEIDASKTVKSKTFGEILFDVTTEAKPIQAGKTKGDAKVIHGEQIEISAEADYGYRFLGWDDDGDGAVDNTENPRRVTVTDPAHYIALFENIAYGVNIDTRLKAQYNTFAHIDYGVTGGEGEYKYLNEATITARAGRNYEFVGWDMNGDGNVDVKSEACRRNGESFEYDFEVKRTYHITAVFKPINVRISVISNNTAYGGVLVEQGSNISETELIVEYGSSVTLRATPINDRNKYVFERWSNNIISDVTSVVASEDRVYTAYFKMNTYTVTFYSDKTLTAMLGSTGVYCAESVRASAAGIGSAMPPEPTKNNVSFLQWRISGTDKTFTADTPVNRNINVYAVWAYTVTFRLNTKNKNLTASWNISMNTVESSCATLKSEVGTSITMPIPTLSGISGHPITEWNTSEDGKGQKYTLGESRAFETDTTLYARWDHSNNIKFASKERFCREYYKDGKSNGKTATFECECGASETRIPLPNELLHDVQKPKVTQDEYGIYEDGGDTKDDFNAKCCSEKEGHEVPEGVGEITDSGGNTRQWIKYSHVMCSYCQKVEQPERWVERTIDGKEYGLYRKTYYLVEYYYNNNKTYIGGRSDWDSVIERKASECKLDSEYLWDNEKVKEEAKKQNENK